MKSLFLWVFITAATRLLSQTIENVDFRAVGKTIVVSYDFLHPKADTSINVALVFKDQQGGSIVPKSISGDIKNVKPGEGKRINWDVLADGISLSGKYNAEVSIKRGSSVKIGSQVWATENLNVDRFRNGDPIPQAKTDEEWKRAGENQQPAWCYYDNNPANGAKYGKLYNWYAVNDRRVLAPKGWHISTDAEWTQLTDFLGEESIAGAINGLPGGSRGNDGLFDGLGKYGVLWGLEEWDTDTALHRDMVGNHSAVGGLHLLSSSKQDGLSVRCVKD